MRAIIPSSSAIETRITKVLEHRDTLVPALSALADDRASGRNRRTLKRVIARIESGATARELLIDPATAVWMPHLASCTSGDDGRMRLTDVVRRSAAENQLGTQRRRRWIYPIIVLAIALFIVVVSCVTIVPKFDDMFNEFGLHLPLPTLILFWISRCFTDQTFASLIAVGVAAAATYGLVRLWNHFALSSSLLGYFVVGNSTSLSAMANLTTQLAEMYELGASTDEAFWFAGNQCRHRYYRNIAHRIAGHAQHQTTPIGESPWAKQLPKNLVYAVDAGTDGGVNVPLIRELAEMYRERLSHRSEWLGGAASYLATIVIGVIVLFVVVALFMPLVNLVTGLS